MEDEEEEGVCVRMILWNDKTSLGLGSVLVRTGIMNTHEYETKQFFDGTKVIVSLSYRKSDTITGSMGTSINSLFGIGKKERARDFLGLKREAPSPEGVSSISSTGSKKSVAPSAGIFKNFTSEFIWTHHQKAIVMDACPIEASMDKSKRRVIAYVGGLDIADGRWDTPQHHLFKTNLSHHADDFYQNCAPVHPDSGPREPWHDIHSKVEGGVAHDVLMNFMQRWQMKKKRANQITEVYTDGVMTPFEDEVTTSDNPNSWNCQMYRSIEKYSAKIDNNYEKTIQEAYINAIRTSERFLYLENQYFMVSSFAWLKHTQSKSSNIHFTSKGEGFDDNLYDIQKNEVVGCDNLVPMELVNRICQKIQAKEDYHVYIVIPMFPEGFPNSETIQQILYWQWSTISMMYKKIAEKLSSVGYLNERSPSDYLSFYCLGNREVYNPSSPEPPRSPFDMTSQTDFYTYLLSQTRRHQIYVHSKMMIADDEYVIVGSANINERSLAGDRDSELCVGALQPNHVNSDPVDGPRGDVHKFRMGLWAEHTNRSMPYFLRPSSLECVRKVAEIARKNWNRYTAVDCSEMSVNLLDETDTFAGGHLMAYPIRVDRMTGECFPDPLCFPDTNAFVTGKLSGNIPNNITV
eukprot:TRINITY_DN1365_c0_g1_i1.p1 TRINITY_DN1365_c0_g1~~TRINITY_DN1365_c0_g1_i1.p1  ORF type:complete len:633 (+),score=152.49 TRINITY_DN1365_c0_g1_i1:1678-3576(+)